MDDRAAARPEPVEEDALGGVVRLHRAVEVEVIAAQVREGGDVEGHSREASLHERVRGDLQHRRDAAAGDEGGEGGDQIGALRRRPAAAGELFAPEAVAKGAEEPGRPAGRLEHSHHQRGDGRLAVGAGDPDEREMAAGIPFQTGGERAEEGARRRGEEPRHRRGGCGRRRGGDHRHGAPGHGVTGERRAVVTLARPGDEQVARNHAPGVVGETGHLRIARGEPLQRQTRHQCREAHQLTPVPR